MDMDTDSAAGMRVARRTDAEFEQWREGVETRLHSAALVGARQLTVFEQWCTTGNGAPSHLHAVEEVLQIIVGEAEVWVGDERRMLGSGDTVIVPAGMIHGFTNTGAATLQVLAILAAPIFEAHYVEGARDVRRWGIV